MNVIVINDREAIPIRAVPWTTGWSVSPDTLCIELARCRDDACPPKLKDAVAYRLEAGKPVPLMPKEWDYLVSALGALQEQIKAEGAEPQTAYQTWRHRSTLTLPPGVFMWKDELQSAFKRGYGSPYRWSIGNEREGERELNFSPMIPGALIAPVMEGFERLTEQDLRVATDCERLTADVDRLTAEVDRLTADNAEPDPRHRKTLLRIIGALLDLAEIDANEPPKTTAHAVNAKLQMRGGGMKPDTIANVIKAAWETDP